MEPAVSQQDTSLFSELSVLLNNRGTALTIMNEFIPGTLLDKFRAEQQHNSWTIRKFVSMRLHRRGCEPIGTRRDRSTAAYNGRGDSDC